MSEHSHMIIQGIMHENERLRIYPLKFLYPLSCMYRYMSEQDNEVYLFERMFA